MLSDEPRALINDFPVVVLEFESNEEIIQAKINTLYVSLRFPYSSNLEVKILETKGPTKQFNN